MKARAEFDRLFREYHTPLYFFARQYVDDEEECRDIVSAAFERAWNNLGSIEAASARSFLYVTTRNLCIDYVRHQQRQRAYTRYVETMTKAVGDDQDFLEREEMMRRATDRIDQLPLPTRDIFIACYVDRKKYKEVAAERGISVSTVKKHVMRALKVMRS